MGIKNITFTLILITIFATVSILATLAAKKITADHNNTGAPDFYMLNAMYVKFDQNGTISNQFYTSKIVHYPINNSYLFDDPHIKMYSTNEQPWDITANKGKSEEGKSKVYLWDNVRIVQAINLKQPNFDITTTALTVYPDIKLAQTQEPITIMQHGSVAKAVGAEADFKSGVVKLLTKVQGQYQD